jgi:multidrug efflux pump subunit AcrA (membrane-fusion protein)
MRLAVKEGQMVTAGQFLLQIDQQPQAAVQR